MSILSVENLRVTFPSDHGPIEVVRGLSFELGKERLGIVGESGSGKSMTGRAIMGLINPPGKVTADRLEFEGTDLRGLPERSFRALRGPKMSMVLQDPKFSLHPVMRIGDQIKESLAIHSDLSARARHARMIEMLRAVRIDDPERVARLYPHEVSGGMGQRIMIAMMVVLEPALMIADEPTSALDVSVRGQVLDIMDNLVKRHGMGLILISHDLNMVAQWCDRIIVMYRGEMVETLGPGELHSAKHPYTQGLVASLPLIDETRDQLPVLDRSQL